MIDPFYWYVLITLVCALLASFACQLWLISQSPSTVLHVSSDCWSTVHPFCWENNARLLYNCMQCTWTDGTANHWLLWSEDLAQREHILVRPTPFEGKLYSTNQCYWIVDIHKHKHNSALVVSLVLPIASLAVSLMMAGSSSSSTASTMAWWWSACSVRSTRPIWIWICVWHSWHHIGISTCTTLFPYAVELGSTLACLILLALSWCHCQPILKCCLCLHLCHMLPFWLWDHDEQIWYVPQV